LLEDSERRLNVLCAFPYMSESRIALLNEHRHKLRFLLDSGAFTAWRAGKTVELDAYCRLIERLPFKPWRYFTLDVVGDHAATLRNYEMMLKRGFKPLPIFTRGAPLRDLSRYYDTSDVVAIGGLVGTTGNKGFVNGIMKHVGKRRVHWLGLTSLPFLKTYRPYMVDTSSWESGAQFAAFRLYAGSGRLITCAKHMFQTRPDPDLCAALESYGVQPQILAKNASWHGGYSVNRTLNAHSGVRLMLDLQEKLGTLYFLGADGADHSFHLLVRGYDEEKKRRGFT
jgi:hypothetical protein